MQCSLHIGTISDERDKQKRKKSIREYEVFFFPEEQTDEEKNNSPCTFSIEVVEEE
jgi:hypothetical protein